MSSRAIASAHLYKHASRSLIWSKISSSTLSLRRPYSQRLTSSMSRSAERADGDARHEEDLFLGRGEARVELDEVERLELDFVLLDLSRIVM